VRDSDNSIQDPLELFPEGAVRDSVGRLVLGGIAATDLIERFGSPLYVYDQDTVTTTCHRYRLPLAAAYPNSRVIYAAKAYADLYVLGLVAENGLGVDCVSAGELTAALEAGVDPEAVTFHGNNKSRAEIEQALSAGIGQLVADGLDDLELIGQIATGRGVRAPVLLRLTPGISAHTHEYIRTGELDSKFGIPISTGQALEATKSALSNPGIDLFGYHAHIGSQIFDRQPLIDNARKLVEFAIATERETGFFPAVISPGGGGGVRYTLADDGLDPCPLMTAIGSAVNEALPDARRPLLVVEPGRSVIARAGVALYSVGTIKSIPGIRTYVAVDGGMADNIRPALYGAEYTVVLANRQPEPPFGPVTVAGRYCESGDILFKDAPLPELRRDDILAAATSGAYGMAMASNYNMALRPAVVFVTGGRAILTRRRETESDLLGLFPRSG
jgi:diaminopimelate decarboxylase